MKKNLVFLFAAFAAAIFSHAALAQAPPEAWVPGYNANGSKTFYSTSNLTQAQAQRLRPTWELLANAPNAQATIRSEIAFGASKAPVVAKAVVTGAAVFGTFKAIMGGPVGIGVTALMAAPAVIDWLSQGNARTAPVGSSTPFEKVDPSLGCSTAPCYEYNGYYVPYVGNQWFSTPSQICSRLVSGMQQANGSDWTVELVSCPSGPEVSVAIRMKYYASPNWQPYTYPLITRSAAPAPAVWQPATAEEIRLEMESIPVQLAVIDALLNAGGSLPIAYAPGGTTGPASVSSVPVVKSSTVPTPPPTSSTSTVSGNPHGLASGSPTVTGSSTFSRDFSVDGKTVSVPTNSTTTSTYNPATNSTISTTVNSSDPHTVNTSTQTKTDLAYSPGQVTGTTNTTTTTTVVNNITNNIVNETTTTENKPDTPPKEEEDLSFNDASLPELPVLYERKYPDGLTGIWSEKISAIKATPIFSLVTGLMPTLSPSGSCPSWPLPLEFASWSTYGTHDVAPPCWVWDFGKVIIVISSLLLARALIFGG